jgi:HAD superfamily hydrolase (TIGR01509 family)
MSIKALIFDFDGTILDTETPEFQSWQAVYADYGCELPLTEWVNAIGRGQDQITFDPYAYLQICSGKIIDQDAVRLRRRNLFAELLMQEPLRTGVHDYLNAARSAGLRLAIASSSRRSWIDEHLTRFDLLPFFDVVRCADDVARTKPDPELYLSAAAALGLPVSEVIAFEDSPNGARAARSAGIFCVAVPNTMTKHLIFEEPDLMLPSLESISLSQLLVQLADKENFNPPV